ncbi:MAG TPA: aspartyl/asparaginyl beta-hydroxylase domain-containing protein [Steroidobacteraceae bacterium]|jgi:aspartyl/asparaginyl beta-hydroxylase (cupin superfamily)|nr:aspartyl/asparaginyl beta-hydroxylase domain-containing protein [Steroidobacteraceae bacterium]
MIENQIDPDSLTTVGLAALQRGDAAAAREHLSRAAAAAGAGADVWFGLALAHRQLGSPDAERVALDRTLELEPRHVPALIRKGDLYTEKSDARAATPFYRAALKIAQSLGPIPAAWRGELARISSRVARNSLDFEKHLLADLARSGLGGAGTRRFAHALDLLLGRSQVYHQQPQVFYFPELPQIQFYDRGGFAWAGELERQTETIRGELRELVARADRFRPYMQADPDRPVFNTNGLLDDPAWSACYLMKNGEEVAENAALCPATMAGLLRLPLCRIKGRTPTVLFSLLRPGAHIPSHHGFLNTRLICHLPLIVPPECALRVGNETRAWREGELVVFDDTMEHEAWNRSAGLRVVLLFDIWRPELTATERALVAAMLESIDGFGGPRREWMQ